MTRVRVRGIYATAVTQLLADAVTVVQPSRPIDQRFDAEFPAAEPDVDVAASADRLGLVVTGETEAVEEVAERAAGVAVDTLVFRDPTPRGSLHDAKITETRATGAIVDLGRREGFLPYDAVDDHITTSDAVTVQVHEPVPPWSHRRPVVGTTTRVHGGLLDLVHAAAHGADVGDPDLETELVRTMELLSVEVPEGWGVRWQAAAANAELEALGAALERAVGRAVEERFAEETAWVWLGREARFALDEYRRAVVPTMAGHHRIKAAGESAGTAVDFTERVCAPAGEFPFEDVADVFGPAVGDSLRIVHGKPDGSWITLGEGRVIDRADETVTVRREMTPGGTYDGLGVEREAGDTAITKLREGRWWYATVYRDTDGEWKGTYLNVCSPVEIFPGRAVYLDLYVDVVRHVDGVVERVDDDELDAAVDAGDLPVALAENARDVAGALERAVAD